MASAARIASVRRRLDDAERHRRALREHLAPYGDGGGVARFVADAASARPEQLARAYLVQASFENTVNHFIAIGQDVVAADALSDRDVDGLTALRVLTRNRLIDDATRRELHEAQVIRNGLQHAYAETAPIELLQAARAVDRSAEAFHVAIERWLAARCPD